MIDTKEEVQGITAGGGCGFSAYTSTKAVHLQMLMAGVIAGFMYCGFVTGENTFSKEKLFSDISDAALIAAVLNPGKPSNTKTKEWDTALHQLTMGLRVTARLSKRNIETLRRAVQSIKEILRTHDLKLRALAQALWDNRHKDPDAHARLSHEEIMDIWTSK